MADKATDSVVTADAELAELIVNDLVEAGLVGGGARKKLLAKLASGKLKSEDWRLFLVPANPATTEVEP